MKVGIIGAGWSGLTAAYLLRRAGHHVTVIEKREHIGGNAYDEKDAHGLIIPKYGAHIFHTYNREVWEFVKQFSDFNNYKHQVSVSWEGSFLPYPIPYEWVNPNTEYYDKRDDNFETAMLHKLGRMTYEIYIEPYTRKFWGREPNTLSARLAARVPIREQHQEQLFPDPYQGMPKEGYHTLFKNMADGLTLVHEDYHRVNLKHYDHLIVTSPLDEWYGYDLGKLEYRGMRFVTQDFLCGSHLQATGTINTNDWSDVLRREEPKQYYQQESPYTVIVYNYADGDTQYYPVPSARNDELADKYRQRAESETNVTFIGRLGQYRYLNQDQAILMAMQAVGGML